MEKKKSTKAPIREKKNYSSDKPTPKIPKAKTQPPPAPIKKIKSV